MNSALKWIAGIIGWTVLWGLLIVCTPDRSLVIRFGDNAFISIPFGAMISAGFVWLSLHVLDRERYNRAADRRAAERDAAWKRLDDRYERELTEIRKRDR